MQVQRWSGTAKGRSRTVSYADVIWTVANAIDVTAGFDGQAAESLRMLESHLAEAGSSRRHLLSIQVILASINDRATFDSLWQDWIGPNPEHWPQRACFQSTLAPGLLIELVAVAAPACAEQVSNAAASTSPPSGPSRP
jgi:enamine deaminase RidA (YjgF/YER057c/UK114 family)